MSCLELGHTGAGLVLRGTLDGLIAPLLKIPLRNLAEGDEIQLMVKLRKEHVTILPQKAGHEAELPGLLGGDEITADIIGGRQGLVLLQTAVKAIEQAAVGEGYVGKAGGGNRHFQGAARQEHLHDALAGPHHVHRIGSLVGGDAEVFFSPHVTGLTHGLVGVEHVHVHHAHQGVGILLAADVLEGGQIKDVVITTVGGHLGSDKGIENIRATVDGKGGKVAVTIPHGGADVPHQLHHVVLADVHHMENPWIAPEDFLRHRRSDGAGSTDNKEF